MRSVYLGGSAALTFALIFVPGSALRSNASSARAASGIDVAGVIETVSHRFDRSRGGRLVSADREYRASFDDSGFAIQLRGAGSLRFRTSRALFGGRGLPLAPGVWRAERNTAVRPIAPGIDERVTARNGHLEWDFVLDRPREQSGALVLEAIVNANSKPGTETRKALRWTVGAGRTVTVGEVVVKDAHQRQLYRALPVLRGRTLALRVPARILSTAAYPLTVDPVISPEYPVSSPSGGPVPGDQDYPAVAFDGTNYLVVWSDGRSGELRDLYGARVTPAGAVLDPHGFAIATTARLEGTPTVAFDGTNFLVVWPDFGPGGGASNLYAARVSPAGVVLDPDQIPVSTATDSQFEPSVAFDGTNYLVAWRDGRNEGGASGGDIYAARVTPEGVVLDPNGIPVFAEQGTQRDLTIAFDGANYLVAWTNLWADVDVYGTRVSTAGAVLDPEGIPIAAGPGAQEEPAVAFDGDNYLVAWGAAPGPDYNVYGTRVSPDRSRRRSRRNSDLDGSGQPIPPEPRLRRHELPRCLGRCSRRRHRSLRRAGDIRRERPRSGRLPSVVRVGHAGSGSACLRRAELPRGLAGRPDLLSARRLRRAGEPGRPGARSVRDLARRRRQSRGCARDWL